MSGDDPAVRAGLDGVLPRLREIWEDIRVGEIRTVLGPVALAGSPRPLPSSAVELLAGGHTVWIAAPCVPPEPARGLAPLYEHAGNRFVMPTVRLCLPGDGDNDALAVEFLSLADWLHDALCRWRFAPLRSDEGQQATTILESLQAYRASVESGLRAVAQVIRYALFGADRRALVAGLRLPACPMWVRPVEGNTLATQAARALVISARFAEPADGPAMPSTDLRAGRYRIRPAEPRDWGIDPVHTPEGSDIRLTGRLGVGVALRDRKLHIPENRVPLSPSTVRLPFAGYDDPRRLLMAANMQTHAVPLAASEAPLVRAGPAGDEPPGVNLAVGYLAWQGWNHEDAWVLSESAARKLAAVQQSVQTVAVRAVEMPARLLVKVGQTVRRGELLVRRTLAPALLCQAIGLLARLTGLNDTAPLRPEFEDVAGTEGEVVRIESWDLLSGVGVPDGYEMPETLRGSYRMVYRIHLRRTLPLADGDKLANRHGHKGVVGAILPDHEMPRWRGRPLDALIDRSVSSTARIGARSTRPSPGRSPAKPARPWTPARSAARRYCDAPARWAPTSRGAGPWSRRHLPAGWSRRGRQSRVCNSSSACRTTPATRSPAARYHGQGRGRSGGGGRSATARWISGRCGRTVWRPPLPKAGGWRPRPHA
jgi:hypothetical protein